MRHVTFRVLTLVALTGALVHCGQSASSALEPQDGSGGLPGTNEDGGGAGGGSGGAGPTKATGDGKASMQGTSAEAGASSGAGASNAGTTGAGGSPANPDAFAGCNAPADPASTTTMYMSVPNTNWFSAATEARAMLRKGLAPIPSQIRDGDFLAYYAPRYTPADMNTPLAALGVAPFMSPGIAPVESIVQIGVLAPPLDPKTRPAASITFLLDTSKSMEGPSMTIAREAMKAIAQNLVPGDAVNLVTTLSGATPQELEVTTTPDPKVLDVLVAAVPDGGEDIPGGLVTAYAEAEKTYKAGGLNRVVFISDGGALPTVIDASLIASHLAPGEHGNIHLVGIGTGAEPGYNPALLERAAGAGHGALVYLNDVEDADTDLGKRFDELFNIAANDVKLELTFPWYFTPDDLTSGDFGSDASQIVATDLGPGASLSFRQVLRACNPLIIGASPNDHIQATLTWASPADSSPQLANAAASVASLLNAPSPHVRKGTAILAYTQALRTLDPKRMLNAYDLATAAADAQDPDLVEIAALLQMHPAFPK